MCDQVTYDGLIDDSKAALNACIESLREVLRAGDPDRFRSFWQANAMQLLEHGRGYATRAVLSEVGFGCAPLELGRIYFKELGGQFLLFLHNKITVWDALKELEVKNRQWLLAQNGGTAEDYEVEYERAYGCLKKLVNMLVCEFAMPLDFHFTRFKCLHNLKRDNIYHTPFGDAVAYSDRTAMAMLPYLDNRHFDDVWVHLHFRDFERTFWARKLINPNATDAELEDMKLVCQDMKTSIGRVMWTHLMLGGTEAASEPQKEVFGNKELSRIIYELYMK